MRLLDEGIYYGSVDHWDGTVLRLDTDHTLAMEHVRRKAADIDANRPLLIPDDDPSYAGIVAMAYFIEYQQRDLADAYVWTEYCVPGFQPPIIWLRLLVNAFGLEAYRDLLDAKSVTVALYLRSRRHIHPIAHGIYISDFSSMNRHAEVRAHGIGSVLRMDDQPRLPEQWDGFNLLDLPIPDGETPPDTVIDQAVAFIDLHVQHAQPLLVHCIEGVSRSVTMVLAYLLEYQNYTLQEAALLLRRQRPLAEPHPLMLGALLRRYDLDGDPDTMNWAKLVLEA